MTGSEQIIEAFASARAEGRRAALMPYLMGGFPDMAASERVAAAYAEGGADLIELGVPFSDPLADGPVIHAAGVQALRSGATFEAVMGVCSSVAQGLPVIVMSYANPLYARGLERAVDLLYAAGASGLIVPDLPLEEAPALLHLCDARGIALVPLVAPTTPDERLELIGRRARGFLYTVSVTGTTGERVGLEPDGDLAAMLKRAAAHTDVPVAVGFGIGTPEQAVAAAEAGADGVIIGSRLVRAAGEESADAVRTLVREFSGALTL